MSRKNVARIMTSQTNSTATTMPEDAPSYEQELTLIFIVIAFYCVLTFIEIKSLCCYACNPTSGVFTYIFGFIEYNVAVSHKNR